MASRMKSVSKPPMDAALSDTLQTVETKPYYGDEYDKNNSI